MPRFAISVSSFFHLHLNRSLPSISSPVRRASFTNSRARRFSRTNHRGPDVTATLACGRPSSNSAGHYLVAVPGAWPIPVTGRKTVFRNRAPSSLLLGPPNPCADLRPPKWRQSTERYGDQRGAPAANRTASRAAYGLEPRPDNLPTNGRNLFSLPYTLPGGHQAFDYWGVDWNLGVH